MKYQTYNFKESLAVLFMLLKWYRFDDNLADWCRVDFEREFRQENSSFPSWYLSDKARGYARKYKGVE